MDNVMREIDVKDAKQHWHAVDVCCYGRHKSENADDQENQTEKNCGSFNHCDLLFS